MGRKSKSKRPADDQSSAAGDICDSPGTSSQVNDRVKSRPVKKIKTVAPSSESRRLVDDAINSVLSQEAHPIDIDCDTDVNVNVLADTVNELVKKVKDQQETIATLTQQVNFLLSYLGIETIPSHASTSSTSPPVSAAAAVSAAASGSTSSPGTNVQPTNQSYASITVRRPVPLSSALKQAVVSAVYRDFEDKDRRSKNVVINGMPTSTGDDVTAVRELLATEFDQEFNVVKCRRLGRFQSGKLQPLLVTMESDVQAAYITRNAKILRQSSRESVRRSVFINPDLTRAEAFTAYQNRCERRQRDAKRQPTSESSSSGLPPPSGSPLLPSPQPPSGSATVPSASVRTQQQSGSSSSSSSATNLTNAGSTTLRPDATAFVPPAVAVAAAATNVAAVNVSNTAAVINTMSLSSSAAAATEIVDNSVSVQSSI